MLAFVAAEPEEHIVGAAFDRFCTPVPLERRKSSSARFEPLSFALPFGTLKGFAAGPADGPPVLLVHGWNAQAEFFAPLALALTRKGLRVYAFDMPAHGQTREANPDRPTTNMPEWVAAMMGVTQHLGIARWCGVVAHSFGALASSFAFGHRPWSDALPLASDAAVFIAAAAGMPTVIESYLSVATVSEAEIADIVEGVERVSRAPLAAVTVGAVASSLPERLLIVHDPADTMTRPADLAYELAARPDRTIFERPGAGHDGILFQLEVGRAVAKFLA